MVASSNSFTNFFDFPPEYIQKIFKNASENEGVLDEESVEVVRNYHKNELVKETYDNKLKYLNLAFRQYKQYCRTRLEPLYESLLDDVLSNLNFTDKTLTTALTDACKQFKEERELKLDEAVATYNSVRSS